MRYVRILVHSYVEIEITAGKQKYCIVFLRVFLHFFQGIVHFTR